MNSFLRTHGILLLMLVVFFVLGLLRLNDLSLYTDSTRYLIWGNSIARGQGWIDDTQPEAERYVVNAPLFPVLLAPALIAFPTSVFSAKVWTLLWGVLALALMSRWLSSNLGRTAALVGVFVFAFNPMMLVMSTEILSEAPFLAILMGVFILLDRVLKVPDDRRAFLGLAALLSTVVLLREVSITLVVGVAIVLAFRRQPLRAAVVIAAPALLYGLWLYRNLVLVGTPATSQSTNLAFMFEHVVTAPDAPLYQELLSRMWLSLQGFGFQLAGLLFYSVPTTLISTPTEIFRQTVNFLGTIKPLVFLVILPLMTAGIVMDLRRSRSALARVIFVVLYLGIILTYPIHDVRFLLPILPVMLLGLLIGARAVWRHPRAAAFRRVWVPAAATLVLMIPNYLCLAEILRTNIGYRTDPVAFYERTHRQNAARTFFSQPYQLMGEWISAHTPSDALIACSAKEVVPFIGGRKVLEINDGVPLPVFESMLRDNGASFVLAVGMWEDITSYEFAMNESRRMYFERVASIANLHLFRIQSRFMLPRDQRRGWTFTFDTSTAAGLLRKGRWELLQTRYPDAARSLLEAFDRMPNQPVILYQQLLLSTFQLDSAAAVRVLEQMYATARATTYLGAARMHVNAMDALMRARKSTNPQERAVQSFDIARLYWNLGYPLQAYRLMSEIVRSDPSYFTGLLWAWHYGTQLGDVKAAARWLKSLESIDSNNPVTRSFRTISRLREALLKEPAAHVREQIRLTIAREYEATELPQESLDEIEYAIGENPGGALAREAYAQALDRNGHAFAAARIRRHAGESVR
jgi:tetratricopeptide (TPR) repeat protein